VALGALVIAAVFVRMWAAKRAPEPQPQLQFARKPDAYALRASGKAGGGSPPPYGSACRADPTDVEMGEGGDEHEHGNAQSHPPVRESLASRSLPPTREKQSTTRGSRWETFGESTAEAFEGGGHSERPAADGWERPFGSEQGGAAAEGERSFHARAHGGGAGGFAARGSREDAEAEGRHGDEGAERGEEDDGHGAYGHGRSSSSAALTGGGFRTQRGSEGRDEDRYESRYESRYDSGNRPDPMRAPRAAVGALAAKMPSALPQGFEKARAAGAAAAASMRPRPQPYGKVSTAAAEDDDDEML
jgi:hypothetical protein